MPALADDAVHGRLELQDIGAFAPEDSYAALVGARNSNDLDGNLRLMWQPSVDRWSFDFAYVLSSDYGDDVRLVRAESGLLSAPPPTLFNLSNAFDDHGNVFAEQSVDRLSIGYSTPQFVIRAGRQALSWGGGLVFRPMDLFDPFAPNATDTEYKPGTDMLYTQFLFGDGSDLQIIAVPRPVERNGAPTSDASSLALNFHKSIGGLQSSWLLARDHGDWIAALEVSGPLKGAAWDVELVPTVLRQGPARMSALANISDAVTFLDRNATVFAEYFHNGFGVTGGNATFATLPPDLLDRLGRGQLFNMRQNYLAAGATLEWTPLLTLSPTLVADLDDGSAYALTSATYSLSDNLTLIAGAQIPIGPAGSEFGGIRISPARPTLFGPSPEIYLQIRQYF